MFRQLWHFPRPPYTLHPASCTLHPAPCTLHPTSFTLHPTPYTAIPSHEPTASVNMFMALLYFSRPLNCAVIFHRESTSLKNGTSACSPSSPTVPDGWRHTNWHALARRYSRFPEPPSPKLGDHDSVTCARHSACYQYYNCYYSATTVATKASPARDTLPATVIMCVCYSYYCSSLLALLSLFLLLLLSLLLLLVLPLHFTLSSPCHTHATSQCLPATQGV